MKLLPLVIRNAFRNKRRSTLTMLSIALSLFILSFLRTAVVGLEQDQGGEDQARRVWVMNSTSLANILPLKYLREIETVEGVELAAPMTWFGGSYRDDDKYFFANFAVDPEKIFRIYGEWVVSPEEEKAFIADRAGAIVGKELAARYGWKLGDKVTLIGRIYGVDLEFTVRGVYERRPGTSADQKSLLFHHAYLNESLPQWIPDRDIAGTFVVRAKHLSAVADLIDRIDEKFANTTYETDSMTDRAFALSFVAMLGNVKRLVGVIAAVVVFGILLVSANTMAMSARERTAEVAILKTIGFSPGKILALFLTESVLLSLAGGLAGALLAKLFFVVYKFDFMGFFPRFEVTSGTLLLAVLLSVALGVFAGGVPALRAARLGIAAGLGRVT